MIKSYICRKAKFLNCIALLFCLCLVSCKKFVDIDLPLDALTRDAVFNDDETANRTMLGIYNTLGNSASGSFANGELRHLSFIGSLSGDDMMHYSTVFPQLNQFAANNILPQNAQCTELWTALYLTIYRANAIVEGVNTSTGVSVGMKSRLEGEAKFIRGFCHFYLVNLWGDVPLALTTDYRVNSGLPRSAEANVYQQIIADLKDAQALLADFDGGRLRPDKQAATALLARVYLFTGAWTNAEVESSEAIGSSGYTLEPDLNDAFLADSREVIWQLARDNSNGVEGRLWIANNCGLTPSLLGAFESGDMRQTDWMSSDVVGANTVWFPRKYKTLVQTPITEHSVVLRLAEQYLIRAEARAQQNKLTEAQSDLNAIRTRAGLGNTPASTQVALLVAIEQERRVELFCEWGHRWLDLKRIGHADAVLAPLKPEWKSTAKLYPIPEVQLINSKGMGQNPGYN